MQRTREQPSGHTVFAYPDAAHLRRHGPRGYVDDEHYKPWLRDDFSFRCLYCRCRETWFPDGDRNFSVEHVQPTSLSPEGLTSYDTLIYACCQCNAVRGAILLPFDPAGDLHRHREVLPDGTIRGLTPSGEDFIQICRLDRPNLTAFRRLILDTLNFLQGKRDHEAVALSRRYLGYPANLPDLALLRPPGGNSRPKGIDETLLREVAAENSPTSSEGTGRIGVWGSNSHGDGLTSRLFGPVQVLPKPPSGPPVYIVDRTGRLVVWTFDVGDDERFNQRWPGTHRGCDVTPDEVAEWPGAR